MDATRRIYNKRFQNQSRWLLTIQYADTWGSLWCWQNDSLLLPLSWRRQGVGIIKETEDWQHGRVEIVKSIEHQHREEIAAYGRESAAGREGESPVNLKGSVKSDEALALKSVDYL